MRTTSRGAMAEPITARELLADLGPYVPAVDRAMIRLALASIARDLRLRSREARLNEAGREALRRAADLVSPSVS